MNAPMKSIITVWDKPYEITVHQKSKSVWIASGHYMGQYLQVKGSTASQAESHWREAARYKGNLGIE